MQASSPWFSLSPATLVSYLPPESHEAKSIDSESRNGGFPVGEKSASVILKVTGEF